jgi:hypothetical protein
MRVQCIPVYLLTRDRRSDKPGNHFRMIDKLPRSPYALAGDEEQKKRQAGEDPHHRASEQSN